MAEAIKARLHDMAFTRNGETVLSVVTRADCRTLFDELHDEDVSVTIKKHRAKRSLDANAYAWVLMDKLAEAVGVPREAIYREAIKNVAGNSEIVCVRTNAVEKLCEGWKRNGLGWQTDIFPSKIDGCTNVVLYYGSSAFDTAQMSRLIDNIIQDCKTAGIETMPSDKLDALLEAWGNG